MSEIKPAPPKPRRPRTPYICFVKDRMPNRPADVAPKEYIRSLGAIWFGLPNEEKEKYNEMAKTSKEEHAVQMNEYKSRYTAEEINLSEKLRKKKKRGVAAKKTKDPSRPKRASSAFTMFFGDYAKNNKVPKPISSPSGTRGNNAMKAAGNAWAILPEDEKKIWYDRAAAAKLAIQQINAQTASQPPLPVELVSGAYYNAPSNHLNMQPAEVEEDDYDSDEEEEEEE